MDFEFPKGWRKRLKIDNRRPQSRRNDNPSFISFHFTSEHPRLTDCWFYDGPEKQSANPGARVSCLAVGRVVHQCWWLQVCLHITISSVVMIYNIAYTTRYDTMRY